MASAARRPVLVGLCITMFLGSLGCAARRASDLPSPLSEEVRARLGTIGVVSARFDPEVDYRTPERGGKAGAAVGAGKGLLLGAVAVASCYAYVVPTCLLGLFTPYLIYGAAVEQAKKGVSAAEIEQAELAFKLALAELKTQESVRDRFLQLVQNKTRQPVVLFPNEGPVHVSEETSYPHLASRGIDTILEIAVLNVRLASDGSIQSVGRGRMIDYWNINPPLVLAMTARARVIRAIDRKELYVYKTEYQGGRGTFPEWAYDNARLFREELDRASHSLARQIAAQIFDVSAYPESTSEPPASDARIEPEPDAQPDP